MLLGNTFRQVASGSKIITRTEVKNPFQSHQCRTAIHRSKSTTVTPPPRTATPPSTSSTKLLIPQTLLAMTAGVFTVSMASTTVEQITSSSVPPFDPRSQRFDQRLFSGRLYRMLLMCDPRLLFYGDEEIRQCREILLDYENQIANPPAHVTDIHRTLWEAQRISSAGLHPDTGGDIPLPFRMSGYVPFNGPMCAAMMATTSTPALLFWAWANQSQNALVNYFNRNASSTMSNETMAKSYAIAVGSAMSVAFGLATLIKKRMDPEKAKQMLKFVAFPSSVVASSLNCYIIRSPEMDTGVPLLNESGEDVLPGETSIIAATKGVYSTTFSRAVLQAPVFLIPPLIVSYLPICKNTIAKNPAMAVPVGTFVVLVSFGLGLPASVAIFPQIAEVDVADVEDKYQGLKNKNGEIVRRLYYNKGL